VIGGPAGIGKSTVAGAVVREARARGFVCLAGGSFEQDSPIPYGSIRDALADYLLVCEPQQLWSELGSVVGDLDGIIPELRYHLNLPGSDGGRPIEGGQLLSVVSSCLRAIATRQPVLLCLEDLHAADDATIAALPYLGRQIRRLPVTVLGTYRTDELAGDHRLARLLPKLVRERMVEELRLRPLSREETAQLSAGLLDGPTEETLTDWLHAMTEGNPLFSEHLLLALRDEEKIERHPDGWRHSSPVCPMPPPIIRAVLERRLAQLDPGAREALDVAAVLGQRAGQAFSLTMLATALGTDRAVTVSHLEVLLDAHLIREDGTGYRFEQPLLREALYQGLSVLRRTALELRVSQASVSQSRKVVGNHGVNGGLNGTHTVNGVNGLHGHPPMGESLPGKPC
jgi:predicted ATPase